MDTTAALSQIYDVIKEFNGQLPPEQKLAASPDTVVLGDTGTLDSLGIVNFLVLLEDQLGAHFGRRVVLLDESYMTPGQGPLRTVGSIADHVASQVEA